MKKLLLLLALTLGCGEEAQHRAMKAYGFRAYDLSSLSFIGCGDGDSALWSATFSAVGKHGETVTGMVCCGMVKGCTVRTD